MVWPASAVGLVAVTLWGQRMLLAVWAAAAVVALLSGRHPAGALLMALPTTLEAALAGPLMRRSRLDLRFTTPGSPLALAAIAAVASSGSALLSLALRTMEGMPPAEAPATFAAWLLGNAIGMIAFAPALFTWLLPRAEPRRPGPAELTALTVVVLLVSGLVLVDFVLGDALRTVPTLMALFPIVVWTSLRADTRTASLVVLALSVAGTLGVRLHTGALVSISATREVLNVQAFHFLIVVITLLGTALTAQREAALAASRELMRRLTAVSDATVDVQMLLAICPDGELRVTHLNRAARELAAQWWPGAVEPDYEGRNAREVFAALPGVTPDLYEKNAACVREAVASRQVVRVEQEMSTPGGGRSAEVTFVPIVDGTGAVTHVLRSSVDTTSRKQAVETARRFNEDLERRVIERTRQLAVANHELEAFGYTLSHDLRAPLRSVEGFSRAILEDLEQGDAREVPDHARRIHAASLRMHRLVDDLLRLSQLPTGDIERSDIDLTAMAHDLLAELRQGDPGRAVDTVVAPGMSLRGDARLVTIAMQNLLSNAWKYTARMAHARIEVGQRDEEGQLVTFVRDDGVGFDPQYAARLFAPFERLHKAEEFEGAGIGLATVQRVIAAHGGRVWAESAPGRGATFSFTLGPALPTG